MLGAIALAGLGGCSLRQEGVRPPSNRIFFPGGAIVDDGGRWLYVVNSNSDLRYNAGTVVAVNLEAVRKDYDRATPWDGCRVDTRYVPPASEGLMDDKRCCRDTLDPTILNCDEQKYIRKESTVRIGSFAGRPVIQHLPSGKKRMFLPVRGDTSIGFIDVGTTDDGAPTFTCTGPRPDTGGHGQAPFAVCEEEWSIAHRFGADPGSDLPQDRLPDEPYALAVDDGLQLMYAGHLRGGKVSLIDLGDDTSPSDTTPAFLAGYPGIVAADSSGLQGITSLTIKSPGCFGAIYVSSRYAPVVGSFVVYGLTNCGPPTGAGVRSIAIVGTGQQLGTGLPGGAETRGFEFARTQKDAEPDRAFILQRSPPALVALDTATWSPFAVLEVCQGPTNLVQQVDAQGRTASLLVTCYDAGEVYVIDPWVPRVRTIIPVGRGPIATVLPPNDPDNPDAANRAYVVGFGGNNMVVLDLNPDSPTRYRAIQRIGFSSATPRQVGPQ